jgi:hypothetical protein
MPHHVVVDGSNIATEGRSMPSLAQLNEAVLAFIAEHPDWLVTVVVDATFGHRIDPSEVKEFDAAVANNEIVAPPAGAVGRGDAFVLSIAHKVGATILSNDSYQEFHGQYDWLFGGERLIGGKPVPHIGWVFVPRVPVRGPISRQAMKDAKRKKAKDADTVRIGSPEASRPMPVPTAPPPGPAGGKAKDKDAPKDGGKGKKHDKAHDKPHDRKGEKKGDKKGGRGDAPDAVRAQVDPASAAPKAPTGSMPVNDLMPFLTFVEHHPVGSSVNAIVESYSSHGAYVRIGDVLGYVPLRAMADPAPRSAREFVKLGESMTLVVESYAPARRSIDLATPAMATSAAPLVASRPSRPARRRTDADATPTTTEAAPAAVPTSSDDIGAAASPKPVRKAAAKRASATPAVDAPTAPTPAEPAPARVGRATKRTAAPSPSVTDVEMPAPARSRRKPATATAPPATVTVTAKGTRTRRSSSAEAPTEPATSAPPTKPARGRRSASPVDAGTMTEPAAQPAPSPAKRARAPRATRVVDDGGAS